ncbi:Vacuolar protein sorting-associate Vta1 N-terminal [Penicillium bovifimosum]|uniref:Vacuolar protein sorting-associate Vta1 N-terminal n=1 Tax=Penicillium bovifimosum TaxID=126998 RepID=A0A9W9HBW7_9EURO|nr:Vacuolar protein sorting-associate Vta1 N-terminal [Penicillium bovifimosum]KAJ5143599.1 Vacuolar protein sorting-associate Vta1 N-terminal [Penicillium bovifimosum]
MASNIPAGLRSADIGRFAIRAAQIETAKPVIAYWCNFHIVNQIIERGLHNSDDEIKVYTTNLVDKLEEFKQENPNNEIVTDSTAASAYVEQFGLEVFSRAEAAMNANKVTKQTADTFLAAATFLELCSIWGALDPEIAGRIKFAKFHAVRIVKAFKAGEDPNATNPAPKQEEEPIDDPDVQAFDESVAEEASKPRQASIEEVPDESDRLGRELARKSVLDESLHPSRTSSAPRAPADSGPEIPSVPRNAPGQPLDADNSSSGGLELPSTPATIGGSPSVPNLPDTPTAFHSFPRPSIDPSMPAPDPASFYDTPSAGAPTQPPVGPPFVPTPAAHVPAAQAPYVPPQPTHGVDDGSVQMAQKHARWAVSALTFDDVETAIKELRNSLKCLGAS